ncbi:uncharacterized protein N7459_007319 [Penicillium hispanicum]|uniref:uncharacterized protein n=1 Tax=Penicillium hispanicum TaxID=1080232 RepID=UPI00253F977F|nr:uncharacterized protein N7459_007319 [Penicillium hispanicum]KAJ5578355.1 hypothetical protein N7459_007319 [Penicillium hispanicum]
MAATAVNMINTRKMRYTGEGMAALKSSDVHKRLQSHGANDDSSSHNMIHDKSFSDRAWVESEHTSHPPKVAESGRNIGHYPLTSGLADWASNALAKYQPDSQTKDFIKPFAQYFHEAVDKERKVSTGLHNLDIVELTYQLTLEVGAAVLLAADKTDDPVSLESEFHSSKAASDDHFTSWGKLLTGLECDPPIIALFPIYLMMCQSFTFEPTSLQADYVYSALTGVDWAQGNNKFSDRLAAFDKLAHSVVPNLDDMASGQDRSFWRIAHAYVRAMNQCENSRSFATPRSAAISHNLDHDLIIAMRALDTIGSAYMCSDGAAWLDRAGIDSLTGSGLANDVMDLHTDIKTGETRNLLRLLYPSGLSIEQSMQTVSTILSGELSELFRGHHRARFGGREDGRVAATSPPYSFCRARHRHIFATMELYERKYPQFWDWTWDIYRLAKDQVTEAGLSEPLVSALKRAVTREALPSSPKNKFYDIYYEMIEDGSQQLLKKQPLGVSEDLAQVVRDIHSLWHDKLRAPNKNPGWGQEFDDQSDSLFGQAGEILSAKGGISDDMYKFAIAYGRLSMALPFDGLCEVAGKKQFE